MIRVLFGDNIPALFSRLQEIEKNYDTVKRIDCRRESTETIINGIVSDGLFAEKKLVILENADKINSKSEAEIAKYIKEIEDQMCDLILIKSTSPRSTVFAGIKTNAEGFMLPKFFFLFLDSLFPGNPQKVLQYYSNIPDSVDEQMIFYSVVKRVWQMLALVESESVPTFLGISPFQQARILQQSKKWTYQKLFKFYKELFSIEKDIKTSNTVISVRHRLDILLSTGLN